MLIRNVLLLYVYKLYIYIIISLTNSINDQKVYIWLYMLMSAITIAWIVPVSHVLTFRERRRAPLFWKSERKWAVWSPSRGCGLWAVGSEEDSAEAEALWRLVEARGGSCGPCVSHSCHLSTGCDTRRASPCAPFSPCTHTVRPPASSSSSSARRRPHGCRHYGMARSWGVI